MSFIRNLNRNIINGPACAVFFLLLYISIISTADAQQHNPFSRLSTDLLDIKPPSNRVIGEPGSMRIEQTSCQSLPTLDVRRRLVDIATQEWGFFGFNVVDRTNVSDQNNIPASGFSGPRVRRVLSRFSADEAARVADSIGGYWSATPQGSWILARQNSDWNGPQGIRSRWRDAWSAAFISWVMCEGGVSNSDQFQRAIAHHTYIDQAIRSTDGLDTTAIFSAHDLGEVLISPGDLLCRGSRPAYRSIEQRRQQLGIGARTHCDVVVKVDEQNQQIMLIGGNVRGTVSLTLLPAATEGRNFFKPISIGRRSFFAHLKLNTEVIEADAFDHSPTIRAVGCSADVPVFPAGLSIEKLDNC